MNSDDYTEQDFENMEYEEKVEWCANVILNGGRLEPPESTWMLYDRRTDNYFRSFKQAVLRYVDARK